MGWEKEIEELNHRGKLAEQIGGPDKFASQHEFKKLTIRERLDKIVDQNRFHEVWKHGGVAVYVEKGELKHFAPFYVKLGYV